MKVKTKIHTIQASNPSYLDEKVNKYCEHLENKGMTILDFRFSVVDRERSHTTIFCTIIYEIQEGNDNGEV